MTLIELTDGVDRRPAVGSVRSWIRFLAGFAVLCVALFGTSALDASGRWGLAILAATLVTAVAVERVEHRARFVDVLRVLGLGRPGVRALAVALVVSGLVLLVFPLTTAVSGAEVELRADWPWLLIGLFAFHGLAEELVWRGFAFRRLREGRSFWSATWCTMPLIAVTHLPIVFTMGLAVGLGAMAVAAVTSVPFGYLYETGRRSVWAPALIHTAIDTFKLVVIPAAAIPTFSVLIIAVSLTVPLLALAVPRRLLTRRSSSVLVPPDGYVAWARRGASRPLPVREAVLFVAVAYALCLVLSLALPAWELTPLVAALAPVVAVAVVIPLTTPAGRRAARWAGIGFRLPTIRGLLVAVALPAAVASASFAIAAALGVVSLRGSVIDNPVLVAVNLAVFSVLFLGEEIGWRGYLLPRLATVMSGRRAAIVTGAVHAAFHLPLLLLTTYQSAGSRLVVIPMVMITITAAGAGYAWLRWSTGSIGTVSTMHAAFNESMQRWSAAVATTSPVALAYTTTETGYVTALLMVLLAGYLLTRRAAVFRTGAQESRALFGHPAAASAR